MPEQDQMTKEAREIAIAKHRAFEVGLAKLCKSAGFSYTKFAEHFGHTPETFGTGILQWIKEQVGEQD